ncbi:hypothetical protein VAWG007_11840 [Aeromonas enteropelogenes]|nr:hypothetical protein VAWG007_11840 [Aeromonas enteropelogenes]
MFAWSFMDKINFRSRYLLILLILLGLIYVGNAWSPSSYSLALNIYGVDAKPDFGKPRAIRSDEWVVKTPLTQALVNNEFERENSTSIYGEDLRINYGLPIFDWGLFFKPSQWGYIFLSPAYAFSLYYFLLFSIFIIGYQKIIKLMGVDELSALLLSTALYFTGSVQFWWTVNAETFAFFPWVLYSLYNIKSSPIFAVLFFWFLVCWQIGNLYPPFTYALSLAAIVWIWLVIDLRTTKSKDIFYAIVAGLSAVVVVYIYFYDYVQVMQNTVYPGARSVNGGDVISLPMIKSLFLPSLWFDRHYELLAYNDVSNICDISTWGTMIPLLALFHINYRRLKSVISFKLLDKLVVPSICVFVILAWALLPIPASIGKFILLDKISPKRLMLGLGLIVNFIAISLLVKNSNVINSRRIIIFTLSALFLFVFFKGGMRNARVEIVTLLVAGLVSWLVCVYLKDGMLSLSAFSLIYALGIFFAFNPLLNSRYIFDNSYRTNASSMYGEQVEKFGLVVGAAPGAVINGLGFPSGNHVLATPQLNFWRAKFPELSESDINATFNRYAHIHLIPDSDVIDVMQADVISVPQRCFTSGANSPCYGVIFKKKQHD